MKKAIPKIVFLLACLLMVLLSSCKAPRAVLKTEVKQSDTLIVKSEVVRAPSLSDVLVIKDICDTVTNSVTKFKRVFVVNGDSIELLTNEKNELQFRLTSLERTLDSISSIESKSKKETDVYEKEVVVKKDWRIIFVLVGVIVAFVFFPGVPKFLNALLKKVIF